MILAGIKKDPAAIVTVADPYPRQAFGVGKKRRRRVRNGTQGLVHRIAFHYPSPSQTGLTLSAAQTKPAQRLGEFSIQQLQIAGGRCWKRLTGPKDSEKSFAKIDCPGEFRRSFLRLPVRPDQAIFPLGLVQKARLQRPGDILRRRGKALPHHLAAFAADGITKIQSQVSTDELEFPCCSQFGDGGSEFHLFIG